MKVMRWCLNDARDCNKSMEEKPLYDSTVFEKLFF